MNAKFEPCKLKGAQNSPPSKSMAHRFLIGAALSGKICTISGIDYSEDILASIDCLKALGAKVDTDEDTVTVNPDGFMKCENPHLNCRESGSTLRFFIPLCLTLGKEVTLSGSKRLFERPLDVYEQICKENNFKFEKGIDFVKVCGNLKEGHYKVRGDISSQFITGLVFALLYLGENSKIEIIPPFESKSYIDLTISALKAFGANVGFSDDYTIQIEKSELCEYKGAVEGDYSNAAFLDAFNYIGGEIEINNLKPDSLQGDKVYKEYFEKIYKGTPTLDVSDCTDLAPVLIALSSLKNGAVLVGTDRLKAKESDRGMAMHEELSKLGGGLIFGDNCITVPTQNLKRTSILLDGHNDHRIVMALSVILSQIGGSISGIEAVRKSYPSFFEDISKLGAKVQIQ